MKFPDPPRVQFEFPLCSALPSPRDTLGPSHSGHPGNNRHPWGVLSANAQAIPSAPPTFLNVTVHSINTKSWEKKVRRVFINIVLFLVHKTEQATQNANQRAKVEK